MTNYTLVNFDARHVAQVGDVIRNIHSDRAAILVGWRAPHGDHEGVIYVSDMGPDGAPLDHPLAHYAFEWRLSFVEFDITNVDPDLFKATNDESP